MAYDVYSEFDLEKHKKTFIRCLEVVILQDGTIQYAVPSHVEKLIALTGEPREDILEKMPLYVSPIKWLVKYTGCISVWNDFYIGEPNPEQEKALAYLSEAGLLTLEGGIEF